MTTGYAGTRFGAVHILESLPQGELRTGERLFDELQPLGFSLEPNIHTSFWREATRNAFLNRFSNILKDYRTTGRPPIIHVETHGLLDANGQAIGFELASGEPVFWADLKPLLTEINLACCLNLLVVSGACDGAALTKVLDIGDRAPVWGVLGPTRTINAGALEDAHLCFYKTLYETKDYAPALERMNDTVRDGDRPFVLLGAEWFFTEVMKGYFKQFCTDDAIDARVKKAARSEVGLRQQGVPEDEILRRRNAFREHLRDHRGHFERLKPYFFGIDICPQNGARFSVEYHDVASDQQGSR